MSQDLHIACSCGKFRATIHDASPKTGNHAKCYCVDCQAFARHLGQSGRILDMNGGTDVYQVQPWQVEITEGREHLALLRLSPKGLNRWFASCCNTPIVNTLGTPKIPFASFMAANLQEPREVLGPVIARFKPDQARGEVTESKGSLAKLLWRTARNVVKSRLSGRWKNTPFFDIESNRSVVKPRILTAAEREKAYSA